MLGTNKLVVAGETVTLEKEAMDRFFLGGRFLDGVDYFSSQSLIFTFIA